MKKLLLFFPLILSFSLLKAQTAGPQSARSFGNGALAGSDQSWINTGNAGASDNEYASFGNLADVNGSHTDYLMAEGFGFTVPAGSQITGIVAYVESSDMNASTADFNIRIVKAGIVGNDEHSQGELYLNADAKDSYRTYGGNGDLWGETWTAEEINAGDFGIAVAAQRAATGRETAGRIDNIRIAIYYFNPTTLPVNLAAFSATPKKDLVRIEWTTTDESGMDRFEIQRSATGNDFKSFGTLICKNQVTATVYAFNDYSPFPGTTSYRLKIMEKSGSVSYSKILTVQLKDGGATTLYPIPWKKGQGLFVRNPGNEKLRVEFYTLSGEMASKVTTSNNQVPVIDLEKANGILYYKVFNNKDEMTASGKIMVN